MMRSRFVIGMAVGLLALGLFHGGPATARPGQDRPKHVRFQVSIEPLDPFAEGNQASPPNGKKVEVRRGEAFLLVVRGTPDEGWYTYPIHKATPEQSTAQLSKLTIAGKEFVPVGPVRESEPKLAEETGIGKYYKYPGPFTWSQEVVVRPNATSGTAELEARIDLQACQKLCVKESYRLSVPVVVSGGDPEKLSPELEKAIASHDAVPTPQATTTPTAAAATTTSSFDWRDLTVVDREGAVGVSGQGGGLFAVVLTAILGGFISLATPCVFPMIPITVSIFLKQSEGGGGAILKAAVYCLTLVAVLTAGGIALGSALQSISQHWATNLVLTGIFIFFALSLFGMYEITLPSWLSDMTSSGEGKGGVLGVVFMALTFSIISFACVGPIYGGFTALSASNSSAFEGWAQRLLAPLAFSLAFASPFFVLALFPSLLRSMPKSGSWMNTVKVTMGFLELAAAFKFVRAAELNLRAASDYFSFDLVLGIYIALCLAAGLYLLGVYRLPHDHDAPESIGVPRLVFAMTFLALAFYFLPGAFKDDKGRSQKPRGVVYEWTRAFLLPDDPSDWSANLALALSQADREDKALFIDFTGLG